MRPQSAAATQIVRDHAGMKPPCQVEGCARPVRCKGLCQLHYARLRAHGDPTISLTARNTGACCRVAGCAEPAVGRGYCGAHYRRELRYGDPHIDPTQRPERQCSVAGCGRTVRAFGLCWAHNNRRKRGLPLDSPMRHGRRLWQDAVCQTAGCGREVLCKGLCSRCYERARYRRRHPVS